MNTLSDAFPDSAPQAQAAATASLAPTRPFYWSVRRELWEHRSLYMAPLVAAGVVLLGFVIGTRARMHGNLQFDLGSHNADPRLIALPYHLGAAVVVVTGMIVALFYCLGALHNERRDRSILFWKSLPVSDLTTVLSKVTIPMVVTPIVSVGIVIALQLAMAAFNVIALLLHGQSPAVLFAQTPLASMFVVLVYGLVALSIWYAPVYAWLLLVSAWSKRAAFLWAVLPPLGLCVLEKIAFDTSRFAAVVGDRLGGSFDAAFNSVGHGEMSISVDQIDPIRFLTDPSVWAGLVVAAGLLAGAVWLRRRREPI
jgi:ABC-2 type transport system permease protein